MVVKNAGIQFHRRSRYEDILELVNDNEEALKPFPNRDAVFYKQSNKGTRFDGKDHLDNLRILEKQIAENKARHEMLREYATDNELTHRSLFTQNDRPEPDQPRSPEMYNIGTDQDDMSFVEEFGTPQEQQLMEVNQVLQNIATAQQSNQQAITQAHQQQLEREEQGGTGILRTLGNSALSLGSNIAGNVASGMDFSSALVSGMSQEALQVLRDTLMTRIVPPPGPIISGERLNTVINASPNYPRLGLGLGCRRGHFHFVQVLLSCCPAQLNQNLKQLQNLQDPANLLKPNTVRHRA